MAVKITDEQIEVMINIIGAVETGGQVYGKRRYDAYAEAAANTQNEVSITIGAFQEYYWYAKELLQEILDVYPTVFRKYDNANIESDLKISDWKGYSPSKTSVKAKAIINIISSAEGRKIQDLRIKRLIETYIAYAESLGVTDVDAIFMCANFIHQGGKSACKRIIAKTNKPYTLDNLYEACKTDTGNQVGAYKTRQKMVYDSLKKYITTENSNKNEIVINQDNPNNVMIGQKWLNNYYGTTIEKYCKSKLECDGVYGKKSRAAAVCVWKDVVNRKFGFKLTQSNDNFSVNCKKAAKNIVIKYGNSGTLVYLIQFILSAKGFYKGKMDGEFGNMTMESIKKFQKESGFASSECDGIVGMNTWYKLFN